MLSVIFQKELVNCKRQVELDCAKGVAVIFMVWVHVNEYYQSEAYEGGIYNRLVEFLGSPPAAPVFMFLLGVGVVYTRHKKASQLAARGVRLLIGGYVFSFVRDMIPWLIIYALEGDKRNIATGSDLLWGIDILQFAGLTFLFFAIVRKYCLTHMQIGYLWCVFAAFHILVGKVSYPNSVLNDVFGLFWGTSSYSWFPFLNWCTYPIAGYIFGNYLIRCCDKRKLYERIFLAAGGISMPLWLYSWENHVQFGAFGELWQEAYYHHDIVGNFVMLCFVFMWISLFYFITPHIPKLLRKCLVRWGRNITGIYILSYIMITWSYIWLNRDGYAPPVVCLMAVIIFVLSDGLVYVYKGLKASLLGKKEKV